MVPEEYTRYIRQLIIPGWGESAQNRLRESTIFVAGAGGLGSPALLYLTAAGIGRIIVCDIGAVEVSNLNRQVLHPTESIDRAKSESAAAALTALNPHVEIDTRSVYIDDESIDELARGSDILVDCLDNFPSRYVLNRYAVRTETPFVHAGVEGLSGQATFIHPPETPCLNCIFPETPIETGEAEEERTIPIVGAAAGLIGCLEALEVLKHLTGIGSTLKGRILHFDGDMSKTFEFTVEKNPGCSVCGRG
ncbi:MAG: HesA/MoeB/ThiF family protein [bacterium]